MTIVFENNDFIIADKPHGLPTVPLKNKNEDTLLSQVAAVCPDVLTVKGNNPWEGGALHRLDTATSGLVMFAKNIDFYNYMLEVQKKDGFLKRYTAQSDITDKKTDTVVETYFRHFGPKGVMVKPVTDISKAESPRLYTTKIKSLYNTENTTVYQCVITRGFKHQIRSHMAYIGHPITGDSLYNPEYKDKKTDLLLTCTGLVFKLKNGETFTYNLQ